MTSTQQADVDTAPADQPRPSADLAKPVAALVIGVAMLVLAFANLSHMPQWADQHGAIWVYLGFFVFMSIAGRLFWFGADGLIKRLRGGQ
ncbi:hypothetical protein JMUB6875_76950 [Nocardia sp. JMUB6875]|uniref:hypothetical protein n=1 Tax=Nocardia sp. JMUB6875 TaxID=3158170 RepID=UPI0032E5C349